MRRRMGPRGTRRRRAGAHPALISIAGQALGETLWTTRCIVCDAPGSALCADCLLKLPYIDRLRACPRCGAPNGLLVCTDCNSFTLHEAGRDEAPFERCVSAIEHRGAARGIVTGYKDSGERQLAAVIARLTLQALPREWLCSRPTLTFVPDDRKSRKRRGFDHMEAVTAEIAGRAGLPWRRLLLKEEGTDQRGLSRRGRFENMGRRLRATPGAGCGGVDDLVLIDDVLTTGATLFAACDALAQAGARRIRCATFARTV